LNLADLVALPIFKEKGVANAQHLAVNLKYSVALTVFDPKIIANGKQTFPQPVLGGGASATKYLPLFAALLTAIAESVFITIPSPN
jgi:hypothetical protein